MQSDGVLSTSHAANNFIGTGLFMLVNRSKRVGFSVNTFDIFDRSILFAFSLQIIAVAMAIVVLSAIGRPTRSPKHLPGTPEYSFACFSPNSGCFLFSSFYYCSYFLRTRIYIQIDENFWVSIFLPCKYVCVCVCVDFGISAELYF